jgi:hypothetical protein
VATNVTAAVLTDIGASLAAEATMQFEVARRREEPMRISRGLRDVPAGLLSVFHQRMSGRFRTAVRKS